MAAETGIPAVDTVLVWGGAFSLTAGLLTLAWRGIRGGVRLGRRVDEFIDDWRGEPARPGVPERPGVMVRMAGMEDRLAVLEDGLDRVMHELYPNSGGSLRDAVDLANHRLALLCPETPVPPGDTDGDTRGRTGDPGGDSPDVTSGDTGGDTAGDTGDTGRPPVPDS